MLLAVLELAGHNSLTTLEQKMEKLKQLGPHKTMAVLLQLAILEVIELFRVKERQLVPPPLIRDQTTLDRPLQVRDPIKGIQHSQGKVLVLVEAENTASVIYPYKHNSLKMIKHILLASTIFGQL